MGQTVTATDRGPLTNRQTANTGMSMVAVDRLMSAAALLVVIALPVLARDGGDQIQAGHVLYNARRALCHAADLGGHEGPQLVNQEREPCRRNLP